MFRITLFFLVFTFVVSTGFADTTAHCCGWLDSKSLDSDHVGWCWSTEEDHIVLNDASIGCGLFHLNHNDLNDEDLARIEEILTEARTEIEMILSEYHDNDEIIPSRGCRCCH